MMNNKDDVTSIEIKMIKWDTVMRKFEQQFPGLKIDDMRPYDSFQLYVWLKDCENSLIATYIPETGLFEVKTTLETWTL